MLYVGLDVHLRGSSVCIIQGKGDTFKCVKEYRVRGARHEVIKSLRRLKEPFKVCFEASCGYGYLYDKLQGMAEEVKVAHPGQLRLIFRSKRKHDRVDAKKLATLLLLDQVPEVHVPSEEVRSWRSLITFRHKLVKDRTKVKNQLRAVCRSHGLEVPSGRQLWTKGGLAFLAQVRLPTEATTVQRDMLLDELRHVEEKIQRLEKVLDKIAGRHPGVGLLQTIPGVGPRTAEAILAWIDDPSRFQRIKQIGCYFGLVPSQDQSLDTDRRGHITREGPGLVRKLLVEAAWQGIRRSARIRQTFEQVQRGDPGKRKKIAVVATAHYLARVMLSMLQTGETWRPEAEEKQVA